MGVIFPLGVGGKIVLCLIAVAVIAIWSMLQWPEWWKRKFGKGKVETKEVVEPPKMDEEKRRRGRPPKQQDTVAP